MNKHKGKIIFFAVCMLLLSAAFFSTDTPDEPAQHIPGYIQSSAENIKKSSEHILETSDVKTTSQSEISDKTPSTLPQITSSAQNPGIKESENNSDEKICYLSVRCDTVLNNLSKLKKEKQDIIPQDGIIFAERSVELYEGDSVFDVLLREMKNNKIHLEFEDAPVYNSSYIEGIANIYEFDCGNLSGWTYKVNGVFPGVGASQFILDGGDRVEWVYTCDMGKDVGKK